MHWEAVNTHMANSITNQEGAFANGQSSSHIDGAFNLHIVSSTDLYYRKIYLGNDFIPSVVFSDFVSPFTRSNMQCDVLGWALFRWRCLMRPILSNLTIT
jgi:hypothetical protein